MFSGLTLITPPASEPVSVADAKAHSRIFVDVDDSLVAGYLTSARNICEMTLKRALMPQTWRYALKNWPGRDYVSGQQITGNAIDLTRYNHIEIPLPPLISVSAFTYRDTSGTTFSMTQGFDSAAGNYLLDLECEPGRIVLPYSGIWPTTILLPASPILITFMCGYQSFASVVSIDANGVVAKTSGDGFLPSLAGSWVGINGRSYNVLSVADDDHLQLVGAPLELAGLSNKAFTGNSVPMPIRHAILYLAGHSYENRETIQVGRGIVGIEVPKTTDDLLAPYRVYRFAA